MLWSRLFRNIFIRTQPTPNPSFLQFFPGVTLLNSGTLDFPAPRTAQSFPLAMKLFQIEGVTRVFFAKDYVSIGKSADSDWSILKPLVFETLMVHLSSGETLLTEVEPNEDTKILDTDSKELALVKEIIEFRIRPFVRDDGGDVSLVKFEEDTGKVLLQMKGSCSGCPSSSVTLKNGIEKMLTHYVKSVKIVEAIDSLLF
jgi:NFU1 iron-sulfur cluster scaffold homolog, mitochondrial